MTVPSIGAANTARTSNVITAAGNAATADFDAMIVSLVTSQSPRVEPGKQVVSTSHCLLFAFGPSASHNLSEVLAALIDKRTQRDEGIHKIKVK